MTEKDKYDPAVHVTAGELRANGIKIPEDIPDVGFVRRDSIKHEVDVGATEKQIAAGEMRATLRFDFTEPFEWVEITVPVEATQTCPICDGAGTVPGAFLAHVRHECAECDGLGFIPADPPLEAARLASEYPQESVCEGCGDVVAFVRAHVQFGDEILAADVIRPDGTKPTDDVDLVCPRGCGGPFTLRPRGDRTKCLRCAGAGLLSPNEVDGKPDSCPSCHGTGAEAVPRPNVETSEPFPATGRIPDPRSILHPDPLETIDPKAVKSIACPECSGTGRGDMEPETCPRCNGTGQWPYGSSPCLGCNGTGKRAFDEKPCPVCGGDGKVKE